MSTTDRPPERASAASDVAAACRDADFVRLVAAGTGDALAATGLLARALDATGTPFQASVVAGPTDAIAATDADATVALGRSDAAADAVLSGGSTPVSELALDVVQELGADADHALASAGATVSEATPSASFLDAVAEAGVERRPGVGVPTTDLADGLAHSTLVHAPFSGDAEAVRAALAECNLMLAAEDGSALDDDQRRTLASMVAMKTVAAEDASVDAAKAVERLLRPAVGGPFETVAGYGDVLDAVAREQPGTGVALALGHDARESALAAWRSHGERAHRALRTATTGRYDGLFVARGDEPGADTGTVPVGTAARLLRDFRSPEPVALYVTDGHAAAASTDESAVAAAMATAAEAVDGAATGTGRRAQATFETDTASFITAFREAL